MKKHLLLTSLFIIVSGFSNLAEAQFGLKGIKNAVNKATEKGVDKLLGIEDEPKTDTQKSNTNSHNNSGVKGKKLSATEINTHITNAQSAIKSEEWSNGRFEVKSALHGVEIEIGYALLAKFPTTVNGITSNKESDNVVSTGIGFIGMVVSRNYENKNKKISATIGNEGALGLSYNLYASGAYSQEGTDKQSKSVTVQGYRGNLIFDGENTYSLGVSFGQSSIFVIGCEDCSSEDEVLDAAKSFVISDFEEMLKDDSSSDQSGNASSYVSAAKSNYSSKKLEATRYELKRSLVEIDEEIGKKILEMLPTQLAGLNYVKEQDENIANGASVAGVYVKRFYQSSDKKKSIEFGLLDDSPLMAMVSAFISNPLLVGISGKKTVKIDGYKGMIEKVDGSDPVEHTINIPSNQSMLTLEYSGISASEVTSSSQNLPVGEIFKMIK